MGIYKALTINELASNEYAIVPLREIDIFEVKQWRNDQIDVLRQNTVLTDRDQKEYYDRCVVPGFSETKPTIILFSYLEHNMCIGYGGLTNIDWENKRAELSFLVQTDRARNVQQYRKDFSHFLRLLKQVAFNELRFNRIFTETFDVRANHVLILEENGFVLEGRLKQHMLIRGRFVDSLIHGCLREYHHA
jgi:RimJ/RimL family protein N-acetyltransferase